MNRGRLCGVEAFRRRGTDPAGVEELSPVVAPATRGYGNRVLSVPRIGAYKVAAYPGVCDPGLWLCHRSAVGEGPCGVTALRPWGRPGGVGVLEGGPCGGDAIRNALGVSGGAASRGVLDSWSLGSGAFRRCYRGTRARPGHRTMIVRCTETSFLESPSTLRYSTASRSCGAGALPSSTCSVCSRPATAIRPS